MLPLSSLHDVTFDIHDNCNNCCPPFHKKIPKKTTTDKIEETDKKVKRVRCNII